ncbi:hypothetical protein ACFLS9_03890 [Bacteroidota bacterium]
MLVISRTSFLFIFIFCSRLLSQSDRYKFYDAEYLNINNITIHINNIGSLHDDYGNAFWDYKVYYPIIVYDQGIWFVGKIDDEPRVAFAQWNTTYSPGPIINGTAALLGPIEDSLKYRVYKITKGDNPADNLDLFDWPHDLGAPVDAENNPILYGDQTLWTIYNACDSTNRIIKNWQRGDEYMTPLPIEIQQISYALNDDQKDTVFKNVVFFEWTIINRGEKQIDSAYIGLWSDIDFEDAYNRPAIDTVTS